MKPSREGWAFTEIDALAGRHSQDTQSPNQNPAEVPPDPFDGHDPWVAHPDVAGWQPGGDGDE